MDSGRGSSDRLRTSSAFQAENDAVARELEKHAASLKGEGFGKWASWARQRFIDLALRSEAPDGRSPQPADIKNAIRDYLNVLKDVYGDLVLEPHVLQDTALSTYSEPAPRAAAAKT